MIRNNPSEFDPDSAIIDAELLVKYRMVNRAIETLERAVDSAPHHVALREKLAEVLLEAGFRDQAAQQCLALASIHISAGDLERANEKLLEAKRLDPRVSVTGQLRDVRKAETIIPSRPQKVLYGALADVNLFDIIQILENSRLSGSLVIKSSIIGGEIHFIDGQIIGAKTGSESGMRALSYLVDSVDGTFEFEKSGKDYERTIQTTNNTALILDMLRAKDERERGPGGPDPYR
jgi:tetratricopeptide (TPR) repeat protein